MASYVFCNACSFSHIFSDFHTAIATCMRITLNTILLSSSIFNFPFIATALRNAVKAIHYGISTI